MACSALPVPPAAGASRTSAAGLTLHVEEHGCVGGGTGGRVGHGAVELAIRTPGGDGESAAGRARCRAVCLLPPAIEVPGEHRARGCPRGPAGEGSPLLLPQRARGQRLPVDGGARLPQPCRSTQSTSELQEGSQHPGLCQTPPGPHLPGRAPGSRAAAAGRGQPLGSPRGSPWQPAGLGARGEAGGAGPRAHPLAARSAERLEDATRPPLPAALLLLRPARPAARRLGTQARSRPRASWPQLRL